MYLNSQSLKPSLHIRDSAWLEHSPFAFWLIDVLRPNKLVELGTHNGFSFYHNAKQLNLSNSMPQYMPLIPGKAMSMRVLRQ